MLQRILLKKIAKFCAKTTLHGHRSGNVDDVQQRSRFAQKGHNWWRIMGVRLWHWSQSSIILVEAFRRVKNEKNTSSSVKCEGFPHCFLRLQWRGASWIMPQGCMVNKEYYLEVMRWLREAIHRKRIELWKNQSWI